VDLAEEGEILRVDLELASEDATAPWREEYKDEADEGGGMR